MPSTTPLTTWGGRLIYVSSWVSQSVFNLLCALLVPEHSLLRELKNFYVHVTKFNLETCKIVCFMLFTQHGIFGHFRGAKNVQRWMIHLRCLTPNSLPLLWFASLLLWTAEMWLFSTSLIQLELTVIQRYDWLSLYYDFWVTIRPRHRLDLGCSLEAWSLKVLPGKKFGE